MAKCNGSHLNLTQQKAELIELTALRGQSHKQGVARLKANQPMRAEEELWLLKKSLDAISTGITIADADGTILYTNAAEAKMHGYQARELIGRNVQVFACEKRDQLSGKKDVSQWNEWCREVVDMRRDGTTFPVNLKSIAVEDTGGAPAYVITISDDITERKNIEEALLGANERLEKRVRERTSQLQKANELLQKELTDRKLAEERVRVLAKFIENTDEAVIIADVRGRILDVNDAFIKITGYTQEETFGKRMSSLASYHENKDCAREIWKNLMRGGSWRGEIWAKKKSGELCPQWLSISSVRNDRGKISHYAAIAADISKIKEAEERLEHLAHYDALTDLPNRTLFKDRLTQAISIARRHSRMLAVIFLDLDRFKEVNDTLGHGVGDQLLMEVARRLMRRTRESDTVSRLGGDEFAVILQEIETADQASLVARDFLGCLSVPFIIEGHEICVTASIGITIYPHDTPDMETLLKNADTAMYFTKAKGKNDFQFFTSEMNSGILEKRHIESKLRHALDNEELHLHYQPQVDAATERIIGLEALLRWKHPELGDVTPSKFIPVAEDTGLIMPIGEWILQEACKAIKGLPPENDHLKIAVNLSARQFHMQDLAKSIASIIDRTGCDPSLLELEITESIIMHDLDENIMTLCKLKDLGVRLAVDDFGTGYSSLNYLRRLPIDVLKIDQSFVADIVASREDASIISAIIALAHSLKLQVIAEGVETVEQLRLLREKGCDSVQGFYYARSLPYNEVRDLLRRG